jgi:cyclopropane fatty-acyl-phospholipid synthase-like methyltransferase
VVTNDLAVVGPYLPDAGVTGRSLLHLQCHIGTDTISWARLGAVNVQGLDLSPNSLRHAAAIASSQARREASCASCTREVRPSLV